jgi:large subunit ribosomal protein L30
MAINLKITQVKSGIGRPETQRLTLKGLGLRGPHKSVILKDTESLRGMIRKVSHLVTIEAAD